MKEINKIKNCTFAHRGLYNYNCIENTLEAFKKTVSNNIPIELDVHIIKDNKIVVFHDDNLKRIFGIDMNIKDLTYQELTELCLYKANKQKAKIPLLEEVLEMVNGKVPVIIELKYDQKTGKLEKELVKILDSYKGKFYVKSFSPLIVHWFKKNRSNYIRGLLISNKNNSLKTKLASSWFMIKFCKPDFISCNYRLFNDKRILKCKSKNIPILAWTIKDRQTYNQCKERFDSLICENIENIVPKL